MLTGHPSDVPCDEKKGDAAKREKSPLRKRQMLISWAGGSAAYLVAGADESANETSDYHDFIHEDSKEDGGPRKTSGQKQVH